MIKAIGGTSLCLAGGVIAGPVGPRDRGVFQPNAYLEIAPDNTITFWQKKCEMGQQIHLAIAAIVADELGADIGQITLRQAPTLGRFGNIGTGGSYAVPGFWRFHRPLVAAAREMLVAAAAAEWRVAAEEIDVRYAMVRHEASGRAAPLGEFAASASRLEVPDNAAPRSAASFRAVGKVGGRTDMAGILDGTAVFGADVRLPDMRFAVLARPPVLGGTLERYDGQAPLAVPGVEAVVELDDAVAVVARNSWSAIQGRDRLRVEWKHGKHGGSSSAGIRARLAAWDDKEAKLVREAGAEFDADAALDLELVYEMPMAQHAAIEPVNATAALADGQCTVWGPIQMATLAQREIAQALGLPDESVTVHTTLAGGSFGRKLERGFAVEAAQIASKLPWPVQLLYTREDDMLHGGVRPPTRHTFRFRSSSDRREIALDHAYSAASAFAQQDPAQLRHKGYDWAAALGAVDLPYAFDYLRIRQRDVDVPEVPLNWWRGTYRNHHAFASECALDEFALHTGIDPLELRMRCLRRNLRVETYPNDESEIAVERLRHVLREAARHSAYGSQRGPGSAVGLACHCYSDVHTYVAHAVDVSVETANVTINKIVAVVDCGLAIVPDSVKAQMEGSVIFGLSSALWGDVDVRDGQLWPRNFATCRLMRMSEVPDIEVHIVDSDASPGGMGEPPLPSVTPAFLNAVARAGGPRIRRLPARDRIQLG